MLKRTVLTEAMSRVEPRTCSCFPTGSLAIHVAKQMNKSDPGEVNIYERSFFVYELSDFFRCFHT